MKSSHIILFLVTSIMLMAWVPSTTPSIAVSSGNMTTRVTECFLHSPVEIILTDLEAGNYSLEANGYNLTTWENPALQASRTFFISFDDVHVSNKQIKIDLVDTDADSTIGSVYLSVFYPGKFIFPGALMDLLPPVIVFSIAIVLLGLIIKRMR